MDITYRLATKEDLPEITKLADDLILRYEDFHKVNREKALGWTHLALSDNVERFMTVYANGHKAGYYFLMPGKERYELRDLYILPLFQDRGIGTEVIRHCIRESGGNIQLYCFSGNLGAYSLYERLGFKIDSVYHGTRYLMVWCKEDKGKKEHNSENTFSEADALLEKIL